MDNLKKKRRKLAVAQIWSFYALQLLPDLAFKFQGINETIMNTIFIIFIVVSVVPLGLGVVNILMALKAAYKVDDDLIPVMTKEKLVMIPWFCMNFIVWTLIVAFTGNPFTFWAMPLVFCLAVGVSYLYFLAVNGQIVVYVIARLIKNKRKPTKGIVWALIFQLVFFLDYIGNFIIKHHDKKESF